MDKNVQLNNPQKVGTVIHLDGQAHAIRMDEGQVRLSLGIAIQSGDVVETDGTGQLTILFSDGSELMLGPNSRFSLDSFEFNRARRLSRLEAWIHEGAFVFSCGMVSDGGAAVFQTRNSKIHVSNGKIAGKTDSVERISMFSLLPQSGGYIGSASLYSGDSVVLLGGANDTAIVSDDSGKASAVIKLSDEDMAESYTGLFVGAWQGVALDKVASHVKADTKPAKAKPASSTANESKKTA